MTAEPGKTEGQRLALWTVAIPAIVGLLGGFVSGGLTAYVQLSTKREEYSIKRAEAFRDLMGELSDDKTSRLAVLNLWQLYPDERDRRVITAAAFAVNQPDLVELVAGIDQKMNPVADMMHVRALSNDPDVRIPAIRTLINVDPARAGRLLIKLLNVDLEKQEGRLPTYSDGFDPMLELMGLIGVNETVSRMVQDEATGDWGLFFNYLLYRADQNSGFIEQMQDLFASAGQLDLVNNYLYRARFHAQDRDAIVGAAGDFILRSTKDQNSNPFKLAGTLSALKNGDFYSYLDQALAPPVTDALVNIVAETGNVAILRKRALELLDIFAPHTAITASVHAQVTEGAQGELSNLAGKMLSNQKLELLAQSGSDFALPDCDGITYVDCIYARPAVWKDWLEESKGK